EVVWFAVEHITAKVGPLIIGEAQDGLVDRGRLITAWQIFGRNRPIAPEKFWSKRQGISHAILLSEERNGLLWCGGTLFRSRGVGFRNVNGVVAPIPSVRTLAGP